MRKVDPKKFMDKIVGDSGEQILSKVSRQIGDVHVLAAHHGVAVVIEGDIRYEGSAKSLRAALMQALKQWAS